jgi:hypothetical protein
MYVSRSMAGFVRIAYKRTLSLLLRVDHELAVLQNTFSMRGTIAALNTMCLWALSSPNIFAKALLAPDSSTPKVCMNNMLGAQNESNRWVNNTMQDKSEPMYIVSIENKCGTESSPTNMHFMVVNEEKRMAYNNGSNRTASITDHVATTMAVNTSKEFEFRFGQSATHKESTWRLWWDTESIGFSRNQTLVEVHCSIQQLTSGMQDCNIDVSNVDGLTSSVKVEFQNTSFPPITLDPPADWQCPEKNRIGPSGIGGVPTNFLPEGQACLSNCSLLHTNATCCPPPYTPENCTNANPDLVIAGPEAYTFAYDDKSLRCNDEICVMPLRAHSFRQNSRIMHITTCFTS